MSDTSWIRVDVILLIATPFLTLAELRLALKVARTLARWFRRAAGVTG